MKISSLEKDIIEQQDLYGAPPVKSEPIKKENYVSAGIQPLYGIPSPVGNQVIRQDLYGPPVVEVGNNVTGKVATAGTGVLLSIVLFVVGLIAMLSKKISKTAKIIIAASLALIILLIVLVTITLVILV